MTRKGFVNAVVFFLVGIAVGVALPAYFDRGSEWKKKDPQEIVQKMTERYALSDEQREKALKIVRQHRKKYHQFREKIGPQFVEMMEEGKKEMREILNEEQVKKFEEDWEDRMQRMRARKGSYSHGGVKH